LLSVEALAHSAEVAVPTLRAPVTDLTDTLSREQVASLERKLHDFTARKGSQVAVLIVPTTGSESIEQYSIRVAESWKLGRQGANDGVLLLVAKNDRAVRIEVGYGLEGALPDVIASRIVSQVVVPRFRNGDFFGGIDAAVDRIVAVIEGEPLPEPQKWSAPATGLGSWLPVLLVLVIVGGGILRRLFGGLGGASITGGLAGFVTWMMTFVLPIAIGAAVLAFLVTLLRGIGGGGGGGGWTSGRRRYRSRAGWSGGLGNIGRSSGWSGGGFGGSSWGGGGGGGFRGGGGSFGGGGASGRW
jgi:uncharacterized protein